MLRPQRKKKILRLNHLLNLLKKMPAPLMILRLLKKIFIPGLMTAFQPLKKLPGQPLVLRLKKLSGQLKLLPLCLK